MQQASAVRQSPYPDYIESSGYSDGLLLCDWQSLREQLLDQWGRLTKTDLDVVGPDRHRIAALVQRKYGVSSRLIENYLANLERTLPTLSG